MRWEQYRRGLCLIDPYGLHVNWEVIREAGHMKTVDLFLNFPIADMNRNILHKSPDAVDQTQVSRMNAFWGDESWRKAAYETTMTLFGPCEEKVHKGNERMAEAFRTRLKDTAGFKWVPRPLPMRNSRNAVVYYLFFASQKPVAGEIVDDIFSKYRLRES